MRAIPSSSLSHLPQPLPTSSSYSYSSSSNFISLTHSSLSFSHSFHFNTHRFSLYTPPSPKPKSFPPFLYRSSKSDSTTLDDDIDDDSGNLLVAEDDGIEEESESLAEDGVYIEVMKREMNSRRIEATISIDAPLDAIWRLLTDYDGLADFIPGLLTSKLVEKGDKFARLLQVAEQSLAFGIKFDAKGVIDCFEKDLETLPSGMKRDIEFKMVEGDFKLFEGKWSILQLFSSGSSEESQFGKVKTTLSYIVDVKPKPWLPVRLIEGRLRSEIKKNLISIRDEAQKDTDRTVHAHQFK